MKTVEVFGHMLPNLLFQPSTLGGNFNVPIGLPLHSGNFRFGLGIRVPHRKAAVRDLSRLNGE